MTSVTKPMFVLLALLLLGLPLLAFSLSAPPQQPAAGSGQTTGQATEMTGVPAAARDMVNPVKATPESQARARKVYGYDCAMCHGANGNGKGDLVGDLKLKLKDYTDPAALKDLTDGELFYLIKNGKGQMPPEGDRGKPEDIWNMVILVRSFAKKTDAAPGAAATGAARP
ncbi:MAG TPA: cytochrome c [Granulicella sp.]|jgi:mono/diheme cytochrome c family protein|nr:cytochrome c [Granulicella sp.]